MHRQSGILLHLTSLPSSYGIGDLGPGATWFADFLAASGQGLWQILPIGPTSPAIGNSPYSSFSSFAANPLLISPDLLVQDGWLEHTDLGEPPTGARGHCAYPEAEAYKLGLLRTAFERGRERLEGELLFAQFLEEHASWLGDYALFAAIKEEQGGRMWTEWPAELRDRLPGALEDARRRLYERIQYVRFEQFLFFSQWRAFRKMLRERRIQLVGDAPIYVTFDSADVWANPEFFKLDQEKQPVFVAGVPPDYFSETGQLWGNPVYDWDRLKESDFAWWTRRVGHNLSLYDYVRIDHFRGFAGYWEIPAGEKTAINGRWVDAPGMEFFGALEAAFPSLPIIAEDLGVITPDVRELRDTFGLPGMKIVQFCFGPGIGANLDAPHNHVRTCVAYTGTHDNNTTRGWYLDEASDMDRQRLFAYVGHGFSDHEAPWELIRLVWRSPAAFALCPMQDLLALGAEARMNTPSKPQGNWEWRLSWDQVNDDLCRRLREMTELFGRCKAPCGG
ncbi:4-alpha-glucanotransferase [Desulfovibrio sp. X2]|uniref:4-alpha-glucanotransferase n=1 Tax=Desulfovibrio sp. X2 TaxID=941449 RepID=UPI000358DDCE|nr:4-alpha-glucanotransferase [Desulfovibrio sp. X2]EPR39779.1 4-alpha-glucanotransferase [Desulfovibrio sp. X2]